MMILKPKNELFTYTMASQQRMCSKTEYPPEGGMLVYYQGHPFPEKIFPFPEAIYCIDPIKRAIINSLKMFRESNLAKMLVGLSLILPGRKKLAKTYLKLFSHFMFTTAQKVTMVPQGYCKSAREIYRVATLVSEHYAKTDEDKNMVRDLLMGIMAIWEFDSAYRYRFQDILSSIDKEAFNKNPRKEMNRLVALTFKREKMVGIAEKMKAVKIVVWFAMMDPKVREVMKMFVYNLEPSELALDDGDRYWCYQFGDFNFEDLTIPAREAWYQEIIKKYGNASV